MNIRNALEECLDHNFYLVGSRALGTARPDSDWDYVVTAAEGVVNVLRKLDFKSVAGATELSDGIDESSVYGDNNKYVKAIVQRHCPETGVKVQVAIVADAGLKVHIIEVLKKNRILRDFDLSLHGTKERNYLWDAMYALVGWQGEPGGEGYAEKSTKAATNLLDDDIPF